MNIKYKLDEKDYMKSAYWHSRKFFILINIIFGMLVLSSLVQIFLPEKPPDMSVIMPNVMAMVIPGLIWVYVYVGTYFKLKKVFASDTLLQLEQTCNITPDAIMISSEKGNSNLKWGDLYSVTESKYAFYLFISKNRMFIVPKRSMNEVDTQEFIQLATANMPVKKVKLRK